MQTIPINILGFLVATLGFYGSPGPRTDRSEVEEIVFVLVQRFRKLSWSGPKFQFFAGPVDPWFLIFVFYY